MSQDKILVPREVLEDYQDCLIEEIDQRIASLGEDYRPHVLAHMRENLCLVRELLAQPSDGALTNEGAEPVVMSFDFEHPLSKQRLTVKLAKQDVYDGMEDYFYDKLGEQICQCESVGETNVVDCNCDEYVHDFELVADNACLDRIKELNP